MFVWVMFICCLCLIDFAGDGRCGCVYCVAVVCFKFVLMKVFCELLLFDLISLMEYRLIVLLNRFGNSLVGCFSLDVIWFILVTCDLCLCVLFYFTVMVIVCRYLLLVSCFLYVFSLVDFGVIGCLVWFDCGFAY